LLDSATGLPPVGAGAFSVTVPVDELPPVTVAGFSDTDDKATTGVIVNEEDWLTLL